MLAFSPLNYKYRTIFKLRKMRKSWLMIEMYKLKKIERIHSQFDEIWVLWWDMCVMKIQFCNIENIEIKYGWIPLDIRTDI
jgi:hypothetical protein